jgi:hypothetical protein
LRKSRFGRALDALSWWDAAGYCPTLMLFPPHAGPNKIALCIGKASGVIAALDEPTLDRELSTSLQLLLE